MNFKYPLATATWDQKEIDAMSGGVIEQIRKDIEENIFEHKKISEECVRLTSIQSDKKSEIEESISRHFIFFIPFGLLRNDKLGKEAIKKKHG